MKVESALNSSVNTLEMNTKKTKVVDQKANNGLYSPSFCWSSVTITDNTL